MTTSEKLEKAIAMLKEQHRELSKNLYLEGNIPDKVLERHTKWYAPAYNPVLGVFHRQDEEQYGNCPYIDVFLNIQWKRACIFIKVENIGMGWPNDRADYFSAHHYINTQRAIKMGIFWPFYIQPGRNAKVGGGGTAGGNAGTAGGQAGFPGNAGQTMMR